MTSMDKYSIEFSLYYIDQKLEDMLDTERAIWKRDPTSTAQKRRCNDLADLREELIAIRNALNRSPR